MEETPGAVDCSGGRIWPRTFRAVPPTASSSRTHLQGDRAAAVTPSNCPGGGASKRLRLVGCCDPQGGIKPMGTGGAANAQGCAGAVRSQKSTNWGGNPLGGDPGRGPGRRGGGRPGLQAPPRGAAAAVEAGATAEAARGRRRGLPRRSGWKFAAGRGGKKKGKKGKKILITITGIGKE